jgi:hypothetical protein
VGEVRIEGTARPRSIDKTQAEASKAARDIARTNNEVTMRALTIKAKTLESAQSLFDALRRFDPALSGGSSDGYFVSVDVGGSDRRVLVVLDAIHEHVEKGHTLTRVELDGHAYTVRPT